jgi:TrmH family RNA methyltransferase
MLSKKIVKYIQSLSQKKLRDEYGQFIAETPKVVAELLSAGNFTCEYLCADKVWIAENGDLLKNISPGQVFDVDQMVLEKISLLQTPNKVVAIFNKKLMVQQPAVAGKISLMLDDIHDPGNLGTIIRNADWFGIDNVICSEDCADCYNPKVVQASMGSLARVNVLYMSLRTFINQNRHISVYAATLSGTPVTTLRTLQEGIILIGNESRGVSKDLLDAATLHITIPGLGNAESLNAAVAAGIILSHITAPGSNA